MSDCDLWEGFTNRDGYGKLYIAYVDGKTIKMLAHRLVWMQEFGHVDLHILHSCDTPNCINIDHLRAGTDQDNVDDMMERGRHQSASQTHCKHGHEFTEENTYNNPPSKIHPNGYRRCTTCGLERRREARLRQKTSSLTQ